MASHLPNEIIQEIILILYESYCKPFGILYNSCMLLNKTWCVNTMTVMWRSALNVKYDVNFNNNIIVEAYIAGLSQDSKDIIGISTTHTYSTYYNYASFLQEIE